MFLRLIEFKNFRCFVDEKIELNQSTQLVGSNNAGKSTVLRSINVLYACTGKTIGIKKEDFSIGADTLSLKFTFSDLSAAEAETFNHYVRGGTELILEIEAKLHGEGVNGSCRGIRRGLVKFKSFFDASKAAEKKSVYNALKSDGFDLSDYTNETEASEQLQKYERAHPEDCESIPSSDSAFGATGPIPRLRRYLDWIYIPAVKEAGQEATEADKKSAFTSLITRAVRNQTDFDTQFDSLRTKIEDDVTKILDGSREKLDSLQSQIDEQFNLFSSSNVSVGLDWHNLKDVLKLTNPMVQTLFRDGAVNSSPEDFGHGIQRTYILALLPLVAKYENANNADSKLLLGIEEPELYQHPPQARFLAEALAQFSAKGTQIIVTTHSPYFVSARRFDDIRMVRKEGGQARIYSWSIKEHTKAMADLRDEKPIGEDATISSLDRRLQPEVNELFFSSRVILTEGLEDIAILRSFLQAKNKHADYLKHGCNFVAAGGKGQLPTMIMLCKGFQIPVYVIFDYDSDDADSAPPNKVISKFFPDWTAPDALSSDEFHDGFTAWQFDIQKSLEKACSSWSTTCKEIAADWGWKLSRLKKDPMLMEAAIQRSTDANVHLNSLEECLIKLDKFRTS